MTCVCVWWSEACRYRHVFGQLACQSCHETYRDTNSDNTLMAGQCLWDGQRCGGTYSARFGENTAY